MRIGETRAGWDTIPKEAGHQEGVESIQQGGGLLGGFHKCPISASCADRLRRHNHVSTRVGRSAP